MLPVLFHVGPFSVGSHNFFVGLGVLAATAAYFLEARRRRQLSEDVAVIALGALMFGAVAARLSTAWQYAEVSGGSPLSVWANGGKSILGGLAGAYAGAILTKRWLGYRRNTGDLFAPAVAIGMAIGRVGCFLSEEPGSPTSLPWGIHVTGIEAARIPRCEGCAAGLAMHPSFLYEIAFHLVLFAVLLRLRHWSGSNGSDLLKIYLLSYAVFRFAVEFVRGNDIWVAGLTRSQVFLLPAGVLLLLYFRNRLRSAQSAPVTRTATKEATA